MTLPVILPGVVAAALLAFTLSIDEFIIAYFTAGAGRASTTLADADLRHGPLRRDARHQRAGDAPGRGELHSRARLAAAQWEALR